MNLSLLAFSTSAFFHGALIHVLQSSLVGLAILGIICACRRTPADLRRTLGWIGLLKFAIPAVVFAPLLRALGYLAQLATARSTLITAEIPGYRFLSAGSAIMPQQLPFGLTSSLVGIWIFVSLGLFFSWTLRALAFRRTLLAKADLISEPLVRRLAVTAAKFGLESAPHVVVPSDSEGPGIIGIFSPLLVVPKDLETALAPVEFESILLHELVHLNRRDNLWSALRNAFLAAFWYNPIVWLLSRSIALETEKSCDEAVVRITGTPHVYADGILKTIRHSLGLFEPGMTGAAGHSISSRIKNILEPNPTVESSLMKTIALSLACFAAVLSSYADRSSDSPAVHAVAIFDSSSLDQAPVAQTRIKPVYPSEMRAQGIGATVVVDFVVDTKGRVHDAWAIRSTRPEFNRSAVEALSKWSFLPGKKGGRAVVTHMTLPIVYTPTGS